MFAGIKLINIKEASLNSLREEFRAMGQLALSKELVLGGVLEISSVAKILKLREGIVNENSQEAIDQNSLFFLKYSLLGCNEYVWQNYPTQTPQNFSG